MKMLNFIPLKFHNGCLNVLNFWDHFVLSQTIENKDVELSDIFSSKLELNSFDAQ